MDGRREQKQRVAEQPSLFQVDAEARPPPQQPRQQRRQQRKRWQRRRKGAYSRQQSPC